MMKNKIVVEENDDQRFGYFRLDSIDLNRWKDGYMRGSAIPWFVTYFVTNHLYDLILLLFFLAECAIFIFCFPGIGVGDKNFPLLMQFEYSIPAGYIRYLFIIPLGLLLLLKLVLNFIWNGCMSIKNIALGEVMINRYARRLISLTNYTKWRLVRYLQSQLTTQEVAISWVIWCNDEWKRFMILKSLVAIVAALQLYDTYVFDYVPQYPVVQGIFISYWAIKVALFALELISKVTALFAYFCHLRVLVKDINGCTLTDYYQNRVLERAQPFITLRNPFLEPLPETPERSDASLNYEQGFYDTYGSNDTMLKTELTPYVDRDAETSLPREMDDDDDDYPYYDRKRQLQMSGVDLGSSVADPHATMTKSEYFASEYHPNKWSRGDSILEDDASTDYEEDIDLDSAKATSTHETAKDYHF